MYGLVLEGGGTRGSYQVGAYKALLDKGVEISAITGTSIGALNGAMFVQGDLETCLQLWENIDYSMVIEVEKEEIDRLSKIKLDRQDIPYLIEKTLEFFKEGGLDISPLKRTIDKYIDEEKVRSSKMDFGIVTVNLSNMTPLELFLEDIPKGKLKDYILASAYLPVFQTERIDGKIFLDGAFYDNLPFRMLERKGYENLILVRIHGRGVVNRGEIYNDKHIVISPKEDLGPTLDCSPKRSIYNMKLGYYDTLRVIDSLKGEKYYIEESYTEDDYFKIFSSLEDSKIEDIRKILNLEKLPYKRLLFEYILPRIALYLNLESSYSYSDLARRLMEIKAENVGMEVFKIYREDDFYKTLIKKRVKIEDRVQSGIIGLIKEKVGVIPILNREQVLLEISDIIFSVRR